MGRLLVCGAGRLGALLLFSWALLAARASKQAPASSSSGLLEGKEDLDAFATERGCGAAEAGSDGVLCVVGLFGSADDPYARALASVEALLRRQKISDVFLAVGVGEELARALSAGAISDGEEQEEADSADAPRIFAGLAYEQESGTVWNQGLCSGTRPGVLPDLGQNGVCESACVRF